LVINVDQASRKLTQCCENARPSFLEARNRYDNNCIVFIGFIETITLSLAHHVTLSSNHQPSATSHQQTIVHRLSSIVQDRAILWGNNSSRRGDGSMQIEQAIERLRREGIVAIIRGDYPSERIIAIAETLRDAGVRMVEMTLNSAGALEMIAELRRRYPDMSVGAGTVRTLAQFEAALAAGSQFTVAPATDLEVVRAAAARGFLHLPGVFTATEAETAARAGARVLKLFPADSVGPGYLKALRAPLDDLLFVPTGGVSVENIPTYIKAGAAAVGLGSNLVGGASQPLDDLASRARALRAAWDGARNG
jgi:2-dehydro-3-deoxyphosphogluconate aldolase/(4S)-4-hydroxy-2-oxoglutarate aldolase